MVHACNASTLAAAAAVRTQDAVIVAPPSPGIVCAARSLSAMRAAYATPNLRRRSKFARHAVKQRHKADIAQHLFLKPARAVAGVALERLDGAAADRRNQDSRRFELRQQRLGLARRRCCDQNAVERRLLRPAGAAVGEAGDDVAELERAEPRLGLGQQRSIALDGIDEPRQPGEDGGLVARA